MKKLMAVILVFALMLSIAACGTTPSTDEITGYARIAALGTIRG